MNAATYDCPECGNFWVDVLPPIWIETVCPECKQPAQLMEVLVPLEGSHADHR
jgi:rubrerythrin